MIRAILDLLLPPSCPVCEHEVVDTHEGLLCLECSAKVYDDYIDIAYVRSLGLAKATFPFRYSDNVKKLIYMFKYRGFQNIGRFLASSMLAKLQQVGARYDVITYIPSHPARIRERGFEQTKWLAKELSKLTGKPLVRILKRNRYSSSQTKASNRWRNVKDAFEVVDDSYANKRILLVDDVITTGATAISAIHSLKKSGYPEVFVITVAGKLI